MCLPNRWGGEGEGGKCERTREWSVCVCVDSFLKQEGIIRDIVGELDVTCFQTSIWDETLYRAWSQVYLCGWGRVRGVLCRQFRA